MKRSLLLVSVMSATAAAQAQSSVSITGTLDLYAQHINGSLTDRSNVSSGGNSTSKLTFRGAEDMGGGLRAGFWLEAGISADTGTGNATSTNNQLSGVVPAGGLAFNRRSIVFLQSNWGEIHLGRDWAPSYETYTSRFDVFGVGSGIGLNYTSSLNPLLVRVSNDAAYITPKFLGFSGQLHHWFGENPSGTPTSKDGTGDGVKLSYDAGPFGAVASFMRTESAVGDIIFRNVGLIYSFGSVVLSGNVNHDQQGGLKQEGALLGARWTIGAGEVKGAYSYLRTSEANSPKGEKLALGYVYNLSKRTAVYTTVAHILNRGGSALAIAGSTTAPGESSTGYDLGIRHNF